MDLRSSGRGHVNHDGYATVESESPIAVEGKDPGGLDWVVVAAVLTILVGVVLLVGQVVRRRR